MLSKGGRFHYPSKEDYPSKEEQSQEGVSLSKIGLVEFWTILLAGLVKDYVLSPKVKEVLDIRDTTLEEKDPSQIRVVKDSASLGHNKRHNKRQNRNKKGRPGRSEKSADCNKERSPDSSKQSLWDELTNTGRDGAEAQAETGASPDLGQVSHPPRETTPAETQQAGADSIVFVSKRIPDSTFL